MRATVDRHKLNEASSEMYDIARSMSNISAQLEEVNLQLCKQTVFHDICGKLTVVEQDVNREKSKLTLLAGTLDRIKETYFTAEDQIEEKFETGGVGSDFIVAMESIYLDPLIIGGCRYIRKIPPVFRKVSTLYYVKLLKKILRVMK